MEWLINLVSQYPKESAVAVLAAAYFGYDKIKTFDVKGLLSKVTPTNEVNDYAPTALEREDWECINHLRKRASEFGDKELLEDLKNVTIKFFNISSTK